MTLWRCHAEITKVLVCQGLRRNVRCEVGL
jgi:hypothetical protein